MAKRIPISAARRVAKDNDCRQVIILAWDGELTHIVTYGKSADDCAQAAQGGNLLKQKWGWPECNDQPSRVRKLQEQLKTCRTDTLKTLASALKRVAPHLVQGIIDAAQPPEEEFIRFLREGS
jgi:hypothetical protein